MVAVVVVAVNEGTSGVNGDGDCDGEAPDPLHVRVSLMGTVGSA